MLSTSPQHPRASHGAGGISGHTGQRCEPPGPVDESPEERSESTTDPVSRLPFELATACFRLLSFRGRFAVSHVSRAWRRIALADCCLWDTLQVEATRRHGLEALETLLARSGDVPFSFSWVCSAAIPDDVLGVLERNMGRMGRLKCWGASDRLLRHSAPALRRLALPDLRAVLPADWTHSVPRLEVLKLDVFSIPADFQPLPALTSFSGCLAEGSSAPVLARVFPRLVRLELGGLSPEALVALGPPPPSCRSVDLGSPLRGLLDYSPFLRACHGMRIPVIKLHSAVSVASSVEEFAQATRGRCRMTMRGEQMLILESAEDDVLREVHSYEPLPLAREVACLLLLGRLHDLSLSLKLLLDIHQHSPRPAGLFPSLHRLAIAVEPEDIPTMRGLSTPPLQMPYLAELTLDVENLEYDAADPECEHVRWLAEELPTVLPLLLVYSERSCLETLEIVTDSRRDAVHFAARTDLGALRSLAKTLRALDEDTYHREHPSRSDDDDDDDCTGFEFNAFTSRT